MATNKNFRVPPLRMAVMAAIMGYCGVSEAATPLLTCQANRLTLLEAFLYQNGQNLFKPHIGLLNCDVVGKKDPLPKGFDLGVCKDDRSSQFGTEWDDKKKNNKCENTLLGPAAQDKLRNIIAGFEDKDCVQKSAQCQGSKLRKYRALDKIYGNLAVTRLAGCPNILQAAPDQQTDKRVTNLIKGSQGLFSQTEIDHILARKDAITGTTDPTGKVVIRSSVWELCQEIQAFFAASVSAPDAAASDLKLINLSRLSYKKGVDIHIDIPQDDTNLLKNVTKMATTWHPDSTTQPFEATPREDGNGQAIPGSFNIHITPEEVLNKPFAYDHVINAVRITFFDPKDQSTPLNIQPPLQVDVTVDVVPPKPLDMTFPESVILTRGEDNGGNGFKNRKIVSAKADGSTEYQDQLRLDGKVPEQYRSDAEDTKAEAVRAKLEWGNRELPSGNITPDPAQAKLWKSGDAVIANIPADTIAEVTSIPQGPVIATASLVDAAENPGVISGQVKVIHQPPSPESVTINDQECGDYRVYNVAANLANLSGDPRWIGVKLPNNLVDQGDNLVVGFNADTLLNEGRTKADNSTTISVRLEEAKLRDLPNPSTQPKDANGRITAKIINGEVESLPITQDFFVDLVNPEKPTFDFSPFYIDQTKNQFIVTKADPNDTLDLSGTVSLKDGTGTTCATGLASCTYSYQGSLEQLETITATEKDWACNSTDELQAPPPNQTPTISIYGDAKCATKKDVYNITADNAKGIEIRVPSGSYQMDLAFAGDRLRKNPAQSGRNSLSGWGFTVTPDVLVPPTTDTPLNQTLTGQLLNQSGTANVGSLVTKTMFVDLVAPKPPTINSGGDFDANKLYTFTVTKSNDQDKLVVFPASVQCKDAKGLLTVTCNYTASSPNESPPTFTASEEDWACNTSNSSSFTPVPVSNTEACYIIYSEDAPCSDPRVRGISWNYAGQLVEESYTGPTTISGNRCGSKMQVILGAGFKSGDQVTVKFQCPGNTDQNLITALNCQVSTSTAPQLQPINCQTGEKRLDGSGKPITIPIKPDTWKNLDLAPGQPEQWTFTIP